LDSIPLEALLGALVLLLVLSAFFSGSETSMMAVNRYRLKTLSKEGHRGAHLAEKLLAQTDKLLSAILIGNNLVNSAAAALVSFPLTFLVKLLRPVIWFVNLFVQAQLKLFRLNPGAASDRSMGVEELRTVLAESGSLLPSQHHSILTNLFELEEVTVDDAMLPRSQIEAIDLAAEPDEILHQLGTSHHARLLVYEVDPNNVVGILHVRRALARLQEEAFDIDVFRTWLRQPYYIPSGTSLYIQLTQFQATRHSLGLVVDEYGELLGLITVLDILEEIVGEFTAVMPGENGASNRQPDGSYLVDGATSLRELNRNLKLLFPLDGPRTLNGLLLEHLEAMPEAGVSVMIAGYPVEIVQVQDRMVKTAKIGPRRAQH
jgi:Mg2+/Co2+ transporter CorB